MPLKSVEHFIAFQPIVLVLQPETFRFFYCSSCDVLDPTVQVRNIDIVVEQSTTMSPHKWFLFLCPWGCFGFSFRPFLWLLFFFQESSPNKQGKQKAVEQTGRLIKFDGSGWEYKC